MTIALDEQVPDGPWEAVITLRSGLLEYSAQATLAFPRAGSATPVPVAPPDARWTFPALAGLLALLLLAPYLWAITRRRRRATRPDHDPAEERELVATTGPAGP